MSCNKNCNSKSFWVKSNNAIDFAWFAKLGPTLGFQLEEIGKQFDFSNWRDNVIPATLLIGSLLLLIGLILRQKENIKRQLTEINNRMKSVKPIANGIHLKSILFNLRFLCFAKSPFMFFNGVYFGDLHLFPRSTSDLAVGLENGGLLVLLCLYDGNSSSSWHWLSAFWYATKK